MAKGLIIQKLVRKISSLDDSKLEMKNILAEKLKITKGFSNVTIGEMLTKHVFGEYIEPSNSADVKELYDKIYASKKIKEAISIWMKKYFFL